MGRSFGIVALIFGVISIPVGGAMAVISSFAFLPSDIVSIVSHNIKYLSYSYKSLPNLNIFFSYLFYFILTFNFKYNLLSVKGKFRV